MKIENPDRRMSRFGDLASQSILMVGLGRFELPTSRLSGVRSNQLSYRPVHFRVRSVRSSPRPPLYAAANCRIVREPGGSLKTEQERVDDNRYYDSYRPRDCLRNLVLIRGGGDP